MVKENLIPIEKQKLVEEIRELEETSWWKEYQSSVSKSSLSPAARNKVISKSGSDFVSERGKEGYGPMPYSDEALTVARSDVIMNRIRSEFPNVAELLDWKREATLGFLHKNSALTGYRLVSHDFTYSFSDSETKSGPGAWSKFLREVKVYVEKIHRQNLGSKLFGELDAAREVLSDYIHEEYRRVLPLWPDIGETKTESFKASISGSYKYGSSSHIVWDCLGWISVEDKRPYQYTYKAKFSGSPEIKALVLNIDRMKQIEEDCETGNMWRIKDTIRSGESGYRQIDWNTRYL